MRENLIVSNLASGVVRLTLNRPHKRNALTRELLADVLSAVGTAAARTDLRCLVLEAAGPVFCAGMDLAQMEETAARNNAREIWHGDTKLYHDVLAALLALPAPTIAVVQGPALAGGVGFVLACDLVLASETASFALPEPKRGITAAIVTPLLIHRVGISAASWLLLSGEEADAARARNAGLVHEVVPPADLTSARDRLIESVLSGAPGALAISKQQLRTCRADLPKQMLAAISVSAQARESAEAREGLAAFLQKRPPAWQPK